MNLVAQHYQIEVSTVSRRLSLLEKSIGYRLFIRSNHALQLTEAGKRAYEHMRPIVEQVDGLAEYIQSKSASLSGVIRVSASWAFGEHVLANWMNEFQLIHPKVIFDLKMSNEHVDLINENIDLCIRTGISNDERIVTTKLGKMPLVCVATPEYLKCHSILNSPEDLHKHRLLIYKNGQTEKKVFNVFSEKQSSMKIAPQDYFFSNSVYVLRQLALSGTGVAMFVPLWLCQSQLIDGSLVKVLSNWHIPEPETYLATKQQSNRSKRLNEFMFFIRDKWASDAIFNI